MFIQGNPGHLQVVPYQTALSLVRTGDNLHHRILGIEALHTPAQRFQMIGETCQATNPALGWPSERFADIIGTTPIEVTHRIRMVEIEVIISQVAHSHLAFHENELRESLVVFIPEFLQIIGADHIGVELKLMRLCSLKTLHITLSGDTAISVRILAAGCLTGRIYLMRQIQEGLQLPDTILAGLICLYLLIHLVTHAPDKDGRMVAVALHLDTDITQMQTAKLGTLSIETVIPFVEELIYHEDSVTVGPVEHIFRISIMRKTDTIALQFLGDGCKSLVPAFLERGSSQRTQIGMQASTIDIHTLAIHQESLVRRHLYLADSERSFVGINGMGRNTRIASIQRSPFHRLTDIAIILLLRHIHMAHCLIHLSISHIPELRMKYGDILVKLISFATCKWSHSLSSCHRLAFRRDNLGDESAEHGVGALILDAGLDIHLRLCWSNLWRSNIGTVSCHMHIFEHMQPYIAVDTFAIIPSAALRVSIIIAHGNDIRSLLQLVGDIELEVEITIRILAFAKLSVHIHLGITIYTFKL